MGNLDIQYSEKRDFIRMQMNVEATITDESGQEFLCKCVDLSAVGVLVTTDQQFKVNEHIRVHVPSQLNSFNSLTAKGTVVRVEAEDDHFKVAIKIDDIV